MKISTTALLLFLCGSSLHSEHAFDPFAESRPSTLPPGESDKNAQQKIASKFTCFSSGTLEGEALDARIKSIVIAISEFHKARKRAPKAIAELVAFCKKRGLELHDITLLSPVEFVDSTFNYSATYSSGTLQMSHISGCYFTSDMLKPKSAEQRRGWQPPLDPSLSMPPRDYNLNPAINAGPR